MKNTLELNELGLVELKAFESDQLNGGWLPAALAIMGAVIYLYNEGGDFIDGFKEGYETVQK